MYFLIRLLAWYSFSTAARLPSQSYSSLSWRNGQGWSLEHRLSTYCANPPFGPNEESRPPSSGYELLHATVLVRHGDRSNIGKFPKATPAVFSCGEPSQKSVRRSSRELAPFRSSSECLTLGGLACENVTGISLGVKPDNALFAWGKVLEEGPCGSPGMLSSDGWLQLRGVGETLGVAYRGLLLAAGGGAKGFSPLQIASTDTGRTALSAAALVSGLLDEVLQAPPNFQDHPPPLATASVTGAGEIGGGVAFAGGRAGPEHAVCIFGGGVQHSHEFKRVGNVGFEVGHSGF